MRTKQEILQHSLEFQSNISEWYKTTALHEQLQIEVLIDIRDQLVALTTIMGSVGKVTYMDE